MLTVISVKFSYATRDLWFDPADTGAVEGDHVICATERGTEIGLATSDPREVEKSEVNHRTDGAPRSSRSCASPRTPTSTAPRSSPSAARRRCPPSARLSPRTAST